MCSALTTSFSRLSASKPLSEVVRSEGEAAEPSSVQRGKVSFSSTVPLHIQHLVVPREREN